MDRPILFSAPMVRAILDGRKTMTRRIYKPRFDKWQVGDRLWVRETYATNKTLDGVEVFYRENSSVIGMPDWEGDFPFKWKPSIFMPRDYSRILLEITELKREGLRDISEADAEREGAACETDFFSTTGYSYYQGFRSIWEQINGRGSWEDDPEVVAIGFKVLEVKNG